MSKLKFDRLISLSIQSRESTKVPNGELWRVSLYVPDVRSIYINDSGKLGETSNELAFSEGTIIKNMNSNFSMEIGGIAFKVVENV